MLDVDHICSLAPLITKSTHGRERWDLWVLVRFHANEACPTIPLTFYLDDERNRHRHRTPASQR